VLEARGNHGQSEVTHLSTPCVVDRLFQLVRLTVRAG
jgi:hypothetical protein